MITDDEGNMSILVKIRNWFSGEPQEKVWHINGAVLGYRPPFCGADEYGHATNTYRKLEHRAYWCKACIELIPLMDLQDVDLENALPEEDPTKELLKWLGVEKGSDIPNKLLDDIAKYGTTKP